VAAQSGVANSQGTPVTLTGSRDRRSARHQTRNGLRWTGDGCREPGWGQSPRPSGRGLSVVASLELASWGGDRTVSHGSGW